MTKCVKPLCDLATESSPSTNQNTKSLSGLKRFVMSIVVQFLIAAFRFDSWPYGAG
jgi:hypothetical protein